MNDLNHPIQSVKYLIGATIASIAFAGLLLITTILPSEFGIDPTGLGKQFGLLALAPIETESTTSCEGELVLRKDTVTLNIPAHRGLEYKFHLLKGGTLSYSWKTNGDKLFFDFHGEPAGDTSGYFKSYEENTAAQRKGTKAVPFEGSHGWYWKNNSAHAVSVSLSTNGRYNIIGVR
ncbi:MAG: hypothetical protein JKX87_07505 [Cycloclasticus sp.]|nr:hypothetical protein [Cycloclasticus sp.]